jgi:hypothetical protein
MIPSLSIFEEGFMAENSIERIKQLRDVLIEFSEIIEKSQMI